MSRVSSKVKSISQAAFTLIELVVVIAIIARGDKKGVNYLYAAGHIKNLLTIEGTK